MSAREFRNNPIDRRRLTEPSRSQYSPSKRIGALGRVKAYREFNNYRSNAPKSTTVHRPGSGGQKLGRYSAARRGMDQRLQQDRSDSIFGADTGEYANIPGDESIGSELYTKRSDRSIVGGPTQDSGGNYFGGENLPWKRKTGISEFDRSESGDNPRASVTD